MNDDTGLQLTLALAADHKGDFGLAASIKRRILADRLAAYATFHQPDC
jgi:hypothetical protein